MFGNSDKCRRRRLSILPPPVRLQHAVDEFLPLDNMFVIQFGVRSGFEGALRAEAGVELSVEFRRLPNTDAQELPLVLGIEIKIDQGFRSFDRTGEAFVAVTA